MRFGEACLSSYPFATRAEYKVCRLKQTYTPHS